MSISSLQTATVEDGQSLARRLADELLMHIPSPATPASMPEMLRASAPGRPDAALVTAIYFHAITIANQGWRG